MYTFDKEILNPFLNSVDIFKAHHAFCINDRFYTYSEFSETLSKIRTALQRENIQGKNIGLIANDDIETYASIFAIWLEGAACIPIHPQQTLQSSLEIINQTEVSLVLNSDTNLIFSSIKTIDSKKLEFEKADFFTKSVSDDSPAIIFFTSGSTGNPKGVTITRANLASFVKAFWNIGYTIDYNDRYLQLYNLSFDGSVMTYLFPLIKGACVYTVTPNHLRYSFIAELLTTYSITVAFMVPSMIRYLKPYFSEINLPSLRYNLVGGESVPLGLMQEWSQCIPNATIDIVYGPTENTVICSYYRYNRDGINKTYNGTLSIGKSMTSGLMIIVDAKNQEIIINQQGELCLSGSQLTPGYLNNPELNDEVFFIDKQGRRFYRTGDICFKDSEGDIMFCGRTDSQVKVQGIRIELGEIEFHSHESLQAQNTVAVTFENKIGNTEIALFVEGELKDKQNLLKQLKLKIPQYMMPTKIISHPKFPLNSNGKIDRIELRKLITE
jgi:D-alanine--poly(phosphoribitol) ligase subunit 1